MQKISRQYYKEDEGAEGENTEDPTTDLTDLANPTGPAESTPVVQDQFAPPLTPDQIAISYSIQG